MGILWSISVQYKQIGDGVPGTLTCEIAILREIPEGPEYIECFKAPERGRWAEPNRIAP